MIVFIRGLLTITALRDAWALLKGIYKGARGKVLATKPPGGLKLPVHTWAHRFWAALVSTFFIGEVADFIISLIGKGAGVGFLGFAYAKPSLAADFVGWAADRIVAFEPLAMRLAAQTMTQIVGAEVEPRAPNLHATPQERRAEIVNVGQEFGNVLSNMFDVDAARQDFESRTGFTGSLNNMLAYFGTNITFQMRSLTIGTVASLSGLETLRHLEQLHQSINWAFGFGWLSWTVMSSIMDVAVNRGLQRFWLAQVKPNDLNVSSTYAAWMRGYISAEVANQILDGEGIRSDIRDIELMLRESDLTESNMRQLYQRGLVNESQLDTWLRTHEFRDERAQLKKQLTVQDREWELKDKITQLNIDLFAEGEMTETDLRTWLDSQGWTPLEMDLLIQGIRMETDPGKPTRSRRRFLTTSQLFRAVKRQLLSPNEAVSYLELQGFTREDALTLSVLELEEEIPEDCFEEASLRLITDALGLLAAQGIQGGRPITQGLIRLIQCMNSRATP